MQNHPSQIAEKSRHSEKVYNIINKTPSWLLSWGTALILLVLALLIYISSFIRYPDIIKSALVIQALDTPKYIRTKTSGSIANLLVTDNESVVINQPLVFIKNKSANHLLILDLLTQLKALKINSGLNQLNSITLPSQNASGKFGELKNDYITFRHAYIKYKLALKHATYLEDLRTQNKFGFTDSAMNAKIKFEEATNVLINRIQDWRNKYVVIASHKGRVTFLHSIKQNQNILSNQAVFYIKPIKEHFIGLISVSQREINQVKDGQRVIIKFLSYPFGKYGIINGKVYQRAELNYNNGQYILKVSLDTSLKKAIQLKQGLLADAQIITQDESLLRRITNKMFSPISNN